MELPSIPMSWLQLALLICLFTLTFAGFNHFVQASIGVIIGYLFGKEQEKIKQKLLI
jgi:hypothetical protein